MSFDQFRKLTTITHEYTRFTSYKVRYYTYHGPGGPHNYHAKNLQEAYRLHKQCKENQKNKS